jgi:hypothetical protein
MVDHELRRDELAGVLAKVVRDAVHTVALLAGVGSSKAIEEHVVPRHAAIDVCGVVGAAVPGHNGRVGPTFEVQTMSPLASRRPPLYTRR